VIAVLVYALVLTVGVLVSRLAQRTVLSTAVLFLAAGFLVGDGALGLVVLRPDAPIVGEALLVGAALRPPIRCWRRRSSAEKKFRGASVNC
jgi:hypothetical protein